MPRSQANVQFDIWEGLKSASPLAKLLYHRLLTEKHMNQAGIGPIRLSKWAKDIGLPVTQVLDLMAELEHTRHAYFDEDADEFLCRTLVRRDGVADIPNVLHSACRCALLLRSPKLRRVLAAELRKLDPQPPPKPMPTAANPDRVYVYPDPHGTADAIDPGPIPGDPLDPDREPLPGDRYGTNGHPQRIPSTTQADPMPMGSATQADGMPAEGAPAAAADGIGIPSPWVRGGGGGGGGGEPSVGRDLLSESALRAPRAHTPAPAREGPPDPPPDDDGVVIDIPGLFPPEVGGPAVETVAVPRDRRRRGYTPTRRTAEQMNATARTGPAVGLVASWAQQQPGPPTPARVTARLGIEVTQLLHQGWTPEQVTEVLGYWSGKTVGPHALQSVADEWRRMQHRQPEHKPTRVEIGGTSGTRALARRRAREAAEAADRAAAARPASSPSARRG